MDVPAYNTSSSYRKDFGFLTAGVPEYSVVGDYSFVKSRIGKTPARVDSNPSDGYLPYNRNFSSSLAKSLEATLSQKHQTWEQLDNNLRTALGADSESIFSAYVDKVIKVGSDFKVLKRTVKNSASGWGTSVSTGDIQSSYDFKYILSTAYNVAATQFCIENKYPGNAFQPLLLDDDEAKNNYFTAYRLKNQRRVVYTLENYTEIPSFDLTLDTTPAEGKTNLSLSDAPYYMFCIPFSDSLKIKMPDGTIIKSRKDVALSTMNAINKKYAGAGVVLDVQILPYCPLREFINVDDGGEVVFDTTVDVNRPQAISQFYKILDKKNSACVGLFSYCSSANFSFSIDYSIPVSEKKIQSCCDKHRLVSPNYSDIFEFSAAKNDGVEKINIDCTYKPFTPYIHVAPAFGGLYGIDEADGKKTPRGLICGGDFSITALTSAFETYALQNKNYQLSFQRTIENLEVNNSIQLAGDIVSSLGNAVQSTAQGAARGGVVGAIVGGVGSLANSATNIALGQMQFNETIDYKKDQFGYSLGNIQALPDTLSKLSAFTANNFLFPVLEYYTCTLEEKQALRDKTKYNGMTVMRIATIQDFIRAEKTYIKAKLIRLGETGFSGGDYQIALAIAEELDKGVFI